MCVHVLVCMWGVLFPAQPHGEAPLLLLAEGCISGDSLALEALGCHIVAGGN